MSDRTFTLEEAESLLPVLESLLRGWDTYETSRGAPAIIDYDYAPGSETPYTSGDNNMDAPMLMFAVTSQFDVVRGGVVLRVIGVNVRVANMNRDIIPRGGQAILICCLPGRSDFNRSILRGLDLSQDQTGTRQKSGDQQDQRSHGARRTYRARASLQS